jgi:fructose-1,6-bisphosphatase
MASANFIITGFKRRQKIINEVEVKSQRLRNELNIAESKQFEDHALFLKEELGRYFQQYRELLISHGIIPIHRTGIPSLTKEELKKADEHNLE